MRDPWLDAGELDKMAFQVAGSIEFCSEEEDKTVRPTRKCPRCDDSVLSRVKILGDIALDHCRNCGGFWVDGGELNLIDRELEKIMPVSGHGFSDFVNNVTFRFGINASDVRAARPTSKLRCSRSEAQSAKGATDRESGRRCDTRSLHAGAHKIRRLSEMSRHVARQDELRKLKNTVNDGQLHWLNREVDNIEKTSAIMSSRPCPKCSSSKLRSVIFGHSGGVIDWCPTCHGIWLDRSEFDSIVEYLRDEATEATPREIAHEIGEDLKKAVTGEGPESRLAELGDAAAAIRPGPTRLSSSILRFSNG